MDSQKGAINCVGLLLSTLLAACGGGGDDSGEKMATSAGGASQSERVILELQQGPPVPVYAGNFFQVTVSVKCAEENVVVNCPAPAQVKELYPAFGTIVQVLQYQGNQVQSYTGQQHGNQFVPNEAIPLAQKSSSLVLIIQTSLDDARTEARKWTFDAYPSSGSVGVIGSQDVQVQVQWAKTML